MNTPSVEDAIKAIEEKLKLKRPTKAGKAFDEWLKQMADIDRKYGFRD